MMSFISVSLNTYALKVLLTATQEWDSTQSVLADLSAIHMYAYIVHLEPTIKDKNIMNT